MPKHKENKDPDFVPAVPRKGLGYEPSKDIRGNKKELLKLKGQNKWNKKTDL